MSPILSERAAKSNVECFTVRGMFSLYLAVHCASRVRCDRSLESDFWSIVGARRSRKGAANAFVTPLPVAASPRTYLRATTCCIGRRVKGEVRLPRNHGQETSRPAGSGGSPHNDQRYPSGAGCRAGTPASYQLSRPSRPDPERLALAESRRSTSGTERRHPDRPGCDRASSSPSPSRLLMTHKDIHSDALFHMNVSSRASMARRGHRAAGNQRRLPADCSLLKRAWERCAAKSDSHPRDRRAPGHPKPEPYHHESW